jgi:hypothetical protein
MCTLALFALVIAAVLISRRLAQLIGAAVIILLALAVVALAEERRLPPVPQISTGCPPGFSSSPTSGTCVPSATTRCRAFPSPAGSCPTGWSYSPTSKMCVETVCR